MHDLVLVRYQNFNETTICRAERLVWINRECNPLPLSANRNGNIGIEISCNLIRLVTPLVYRSS